MDIPAVPGKNPWTWKTTAWFLGIVFGVFILLPYLILAAPVWDGDPVDSTDLAFSRPDRISPELNAYNDLVYARSICDPPWYLRGNDWTNQYKNREKEMAEFLKTAPAAMREIEKGLEKPFLQSPQEFEYFYHSINAVNEIHYIHLIPGALSRLTGSRSESEAYLQLQCRLTQLLKQDPYLLASWYASSISLLQNTRNFLYRFGDSPDIPDLTEACTLNPETAVIFFKAYHESFSTYIHSSEVFAEYNNEWYWVMIRSLSFIFQPNNTERIHYEMSKTLISLAETDRLHQAEEVSPKYPLRNDPLYKAIPNLMGRLLAHTHTQLYAFDRLDTGLKLERGAVEILLALHAFKQDHNRLPSELQDLVPNYISQLPSDPYTGQSFQYDPDRKQIFSPGKEATPSGGRPNDENLVFDIFMPSEPPPKSAA